MDDAATITNLVPVLTKTLALLSSSVLLLVFFCCRDVERRAPESYEHSLSMMVETKNMDSLDVLCYEEMQERLPSWLLAMMAEV